VYEHNIYRCMHDVSPIVWSEPVYQDVVQTFKDQKTMKKSDSFSVAAPAGPAAENLYAAAATPRRDPWPCTLSRRGTLSLTAAGLSPAAKLGPPM
jgi:hypothetical protein